MWITATLFCRKMHIMRWNSIYFLYLPIYFTKFISHIQNSKWILNRKIYLFSILSGTSTVSRKTDINKPFNMGIIYVELHFFFFFPHRTLLQTQKQKVIKGMKEWRCNFAPWQDRGDQNKLEFFWDWKPMYTWPLLHIFDVSKIQLLYNFTNHLQHK